MSSSEGFVGHPVGYNSPLQIKMVISCNFVEFGCLARIKFKKSAPNSHYFLQPAATPDQITQAE